MATNVALNLSDVPKFIGDVNTAIDTVEKLLADVAPLESVLPIPNSFKTAITDLQSYLGVAQKFLNELSVV